MMPQKPVTKQRAAGYSAKVRERSRVLRFRQHKMDIDMEDNVWIAAGDGSLERTFGFIGTGPVDAADENGYTPLMAGCAYGRAELVKELLSRGANPNLKDSEGNTAIHHCDFVECLQLLLEAGGNASLKNTEGQTALEVKQEELADAEQEVSDDEELEDGETMPSSKRLAALVSALVEAGLQEESRKKKRG